MFTGFAQKEKLGNLIAVLALVAMALLLLLGAPARADSTAANVRLFGSAESANSDISPFTKWTGVLARYARERHLEASPCTGTCPLQHWRAHLASLAGLDRWSQLVGVNAYVNRVPYQADSARFGVVDHWATPAQFFGRSGDCEDYAIAKYLSLRQLGWSVRDLRIVVLNDESRGELHAVLVAYLDGTAYVLDNLLGAVREHSAIRHYRPIFSINEVAWHFHRDWAPETAVTVAAARPAPAPAAAQSLTVEPLPPSDRVAAPVRDRPATKPAGVAARDAARDAASAGARMRPALRTYAVPRSESLAELFSHSGKTR